MTVENQSAGSVPPIAPPAQSLAEIQAELAKLKAPKGWFACRSYMVLEKDKLVCRTLYWSEIFGYWALETTAKIAEIANFFSLSHAATPAELNDLIEHYLSKKVHRPDQFTSTDVQKAALVINDFRPGAIPASHTQSLTTLIGRALAHKQFEQAITFFSRLPLDEQLIELGMEDGIATRLNGKLVRDNHAFLESLQVPAVDKGNKAAQSALFLLLYPQKARLTEIELALGKQNYPEAQRCIDLLGHPPFDKDDKNLIMNLVTKALANGAHEVANNLFFVLPEGLSLVHLPERLPSLLVSNINNAMEPSIEQLISGIVAITEPSAMTQADWILLLGNAITHEQEPLSITLSSKLPASEILHLNAQYRNQLIHAVENDWEEVANNLLLKIPEDAFKDDLKMKERISQRTQLITFSEEANKRLA